MDAVYKELAGFVHEWCKAESFKREAELARSRAEHEIIWIETAISKLILVLDNRPSTIKQINDLRRQKRELEVKLAFDPYYGAKI
jgi:hypothetical protein